MRVVNYEYHRDAYRVAVPTGEFEVKLPGVYDADADTLTIRPGREITAVEDLFLAYPSGRDDGVPVRYQSGRLTAVRGGLRFYAPAGASELMRTWFVLGVLGWREQPPIVSSADLPVAVKVQNLSTALGFDVAPHIAELISKGLLSEVSTIPTEWNQPGSPRRFLVKGSDLIAKLGNLALDHPNGSAYVGHYVDNPAWPASTIEAAVTTVRTTGEPVVVSDVPAQEILTPATLDTDGSVFAAAFAEAIEDES